MDKIHIKKLAVYAKHGVYKEENQLGQKFLVSAVLYTDTRSAGLSDNLEHSIDYGRICHSIHAFMQEHTFGLIETVAERLAQKLLLETDGLRAVKLTIEKPWAPVGLPLETAAVTIKRGWHDAFIALGSNMGDRERTIREAVDALGKTSGCVVKGVSRLINTAPYGNVAQDDFLNGCLHLQTLQTPRELLGLLMDLEKQAGRERTVRWGPRTLDLDIIFYDDWVYGDDQLVIPHTEMHKRDFVLQPLAELAPYKRHPLLGKTVIELLNALSEA